MEEIWKDVQDYEGFYQVSNKSEIRSVDRYIYCTRNKSYSLMKGRILKQTFGGNYYGVTLTKDNNKKYKLVHRLVAELFIANSENKSEVNHIDGNKKNNKLNNLEWVTHKENESHASRLNLKANGENHHNSKFKNNDIINIYKTYHNKLKTLSQLAKKYNVAYTTIDYIVSKKYWKKILMEV